MREGTGVGMRPDRPTREGGGGMRLCATSEVRKLNSASGSSLRTAGEES
jgi:hypothetical protein